MIQLVVFLFAVAATPNVYAFVQTQTCSPTGGLGQFRCGSGETPKPVQWGTRCIPFYVNESGSADLDDGSLSSETADAIRASFGAWNTVADADVIVLFAGLTNDDRAEFDNDRDENANVLVWRDRDWPYASRTAFAITSVTFNPSDGLISDADIEFNGQHHDFTIADTNSVVDLQNTLTHEAGHFLGLDHSPVKESTMFGSAPNGELEKRTLHPDDIDGISTIYPELESAVACETFPDYFKKPEDKGCCATTRAPTPPSAILLLFVFATLRIMRRSRRG